MGWGPVDWVGRVLPEAKFEKNAPCVFDFFYLSDRYWDICYVNKKWWQTKRPTDRRTPLIDSTPKRCRVKSSKYFLCWAQNYFKREKKAHLAFTWQPHSPFKWNTQTFSLKIFNYAFSASILGQLKDDINTIDTILIYWNKMKNTPRIFVGHALGNHWCCFILLKWDV